MSLSKDYGYGGYYGYSGGQQDPSMMNSSYAMANRPAVGTQLAQQQYSQGGTMPHLQGNLQGQSGGHEGAGQPHTSTQQRYLGSYGNMVNPAQDMMWSGYGTSMGQTSQVQSQLDPVQTSQSQLPHHQLGTQSQVPQRSQYETSRGFMFEGGPQSTGRGYQQPASSTFFQYETAGGMRYSSGGGPTYASTQPAHQGQSQQATQQQPRASLQDYTSEPGATSDFNLAGLTGLGLASPTSQEPLSLDTSFFDLFNSPPPSTARSLRDAKKMGPSITEAPAADIGRAAAEAHKSDLYAMHQAFQGYHSNNAQGTEDQPLTSVGVVTTDMAMGRPSMTQAGPRVNEERRMGQLSDLSGPASHSRRLSSPVVVGHAVESTAEGAEVHSFLADGGKSTTKRRRADGDIGSKKRSLTGGKAAHLLHKWLRAARPGGKSGRGPELTEIEVVHVYQDFSEDEDEAAGGDLHMHSVPKHGETRRTEPARARVSPLSRVNLHHEVSSISPEHRAIYNWLFVTP